MGVYGGFFVTTDLGIGGYFAGFTVSGIWRLWC